jgi:hypothetical protein
MKIRFFQKLAIFFAKTILILAITFVSLVRANASPVRAAAQSGQDNCGQLLADAEARFRSTLAPDGSVPATPETQAAAEEYLRVAKLCYAQIEAQNPSATLQSDTPSQIDDGGVFLGQQGASAEFVLTNSKWGASTLGTTGGTVTYSFMGNGVSLSDEGTGTNVAISSLPNFQACFITDIQTAFSVWQAVSNIKFVQVADSGSAFNAAGAMGDIRIGAHAFDGVSGTLAHAYFPPPNGNSAAGDIHFDSAENWKCNNTGIDIGVVVLHEIGHSLGLNHENTNTIAVMDPYYNANLAGLQSDDVNGAVSIYGGPAAITAAPLNDNFASAMPFNSVPFSDSVDTTGATEEVNDPTVNVQCDGRLLNTGDHTVWYKYTPSSNATVSIDTLGSTKLGSTFGLDTYIAVWTGTALTNLSFVACDDDTETNLQSQLVLSAQAGTSYYIEVAGYTGTQGDPQDNPGGNLDFHVTTFEDVPGNYWAWRYIEGLYHAGLTSGCSTSPRQYCPNIVAPRDQMAIFLLRGKHGSNYVPPKAAGVFTDVPTNYWAADWIEQLAVEGITTGCSLNPKQYCPMAAVTRDQMAIFLLRAKHGSNYVPPKAVGIFTDVPTNYWAADWIEQLAAEGITTGCSVTPKLYCPTTPVTRDQMAVFLDRTFNIPPLP